MGTSRQHGLLRKRAAYGSKTNPRNEPPPADVLHPLPAVEPPRNYAERVEPVLVRRGACQADFPADLLPPPSAHDSVQATANRLVKNWPRIGYRRT